MDLCARTTSLLRRACPFLETPQAKTFKIVYLARIPERLKRGGAGRKKKKDVLPVPVPVPTTTASSEVSATEPLMLTLPSRVSCESCPPVLSVGARVSRGVQHREYRPFGSGIPAFGGWAEYRDSNTGMPRIPHPCRVSSMGGLLSASRGRFIRRAASRGLTRLFTVVLWAQNESHYLSTFLSKHMHRTSRSLI